MELRYTTLLTLFFLTLGLGLKAQTPASVGGTSTTKDPSERGLTYRVVEQRGEITILEKTSPAMEVEKEKMAGDNKAKMEKDREKLNSFVAGKTQWKLVSVDVDQQRLNANAGNYAELLKDIRKELELNIFYVEDGKRALLGSNQSGPAALYFGEMEEKGNTVRLYHKVEGCESCDKIVEYNRVMVGNQLQITLQDEDDVESDVFYLFTFSK